MAINTQLRRPTSPTVFHSRLAICHLLCVFYVPTCFLNTRFYARLSQVLPTLPRIRVAYCMLHALAHQEERRRLQLSSRRRQCHRISVDVRSNIVERDSSGWYCVAGRGRNPIGNGTREEFLRLKYRRSCFTRYCINIWYIYQENLLGKSLLQLPINSLRISIIYTLRISSNSNHIYYKINRQAFIMIQILQNISVYKKKQKIF